MTSIYKKLNHYDWHSEAILNYSYLLYRPKESLYYRQACRVLRIDTADKLKKFYKKFEGFENKNGKFIYEPLNLEVVPTNNKELKLKKLKELYDSSESLGKGQQNFYQLVISKYLGISREDCINFLKSQVDFQLTRKPKRQFQRPINANSCFAIFAIDLVDLNPYINIKENKNYRYILTVIDLFSNYTWFFPIKKKEPNNIVDAFEELFGQTGNIKPRMVISDGGTEFKGEFTEFLQQNNIKKMTTRSYTPQPNVEKANQVLRQIMRHVFVRNKTLAWLPYLKDMQLAKNSFYDARFKSTPDKIMTAYENEDDHIINDITDIKKENIKNKYDKFRNALFQVGDFVRINLSAIQTQIRKKIKAKDSKYIVVSFSPQIYRISQVSKPKDDKLGLPRYTLVDGDDRILINENNKFKTFKQSDLLKVSPDSVEVSKQDVDKLNQTKDTDDIDAQGDIEMREQQFERARLARTRPTREPKEIKPIDYKRTEWNNVLKNKKVSDSETNERYKILDVYFKKGSLNGYVVQNWLVDLLPLNKPNLKKADRPQYTLYSVLEDSKLNDEEWFNPQYNAVIKNLKARDTKRLNK